MVCDKEVCDKVCERWCVTKCVCVCQGGGGEGGGAGYRIKKQEPHTKMWGTKLAQNMKDFFDCYSY